MMENVLLGIHTVHLRRQLVQNPVTGTPCITQGTTSGLGNSIKNMTHGGAERALSKTSRTFTKDILYTQENEKYLGTPASLYLTLIMMKCAWRLRWQVRFYQ